MQILPILADVVFTKLTLLNFAPMLHHLHVTVPELRNAGISAGKKLLQLNAKKTNNLTMISSYLHACP